MALTAIAFYSFSAVLVASGLLMVLARNPVHSVLWLILAFFSAAGLFVLAGAEFVAMLLIIVYVGAVMVLFLFVVMMLDVDFAALRSGFAEYLPLGGLVVVILLAELVLAVGAWSIGEPAMAERAAIAPMPQDVSNTVALGKLIYGQYVYLFQIAGLILLVAMIGAIVLTLRKREGVKKQDVLAQMYRTRAQSVELRDVKPGQGA
ncbi:NADH-quinone oxidoreductase subunit J [Rubrimonas sp.]|uniref:NADH-quinone oxidoreductase subunit J n=1 Tax=Rubrimonas sp. TaxID=2036015 RepID=UPI002FDCCA64